MGQFLGADVGQQPRDPAVGHRVALGQIAQRRAELPIRPAILAEDHLGDLGIGVVIFTGY